MKLRLDIEGTPEELADFVTSIFSEPQEEKITGFIPFMQGSTEAEKALFYQRVRQGGGNI